MDRHTKGQESLGDGEGCMAPNTGKLRHSGFAASTGVETFWDGRIIP